MAAPFLSIVIPAYNEAPNFKAGALEQVQHYLNAQAYSWEVVISDDGSTDGTQALVKKFTSHKKRWRLIESPHRGKAAALQSGVAAAAGQYLLLTDFDQATPVSEVERLLPLLEKNYDIVIGSRELKGSHRESEPWYRHIMGKGFNFGIQLIAMKGIKDTQCGFKLFTRQAAQELFSRLVVYAPKREPEKHAFTGAYDVELLFLARKLGYKVAEVPIYWKYKTTNRVSPLRDSLRMALDVVRIRVADLKKQYRQ